MTDEPGCWRVGFSEVDITAPLGTRISGYFQDRRAVAIHDPVYVRAMVAECGGGVVAFVSCDVLSVKRSTVLNARKAIESRTGIPAGHIAINATHTHTGPQVSNIFQMAPSDPEYVKKVESSIVEAVCAAHASRRAASLAVGSGFEGRIAFNRRFVMRDGKGRMHPPKGGKDILYVEGPMDPELGVVCARDAAGSVMGFVVNYSCHVNVAGGSEISADYPGYLAWELKQAFGRQCVGLFVNGACGNICQIDVYDPHKKDSGQAWAAYMGRVLCDDVRAEIPNLKPCDSGPVAAASEVLRIPIREIPDSLVQWAKEFLATAPEGYSRDKVYAQETLELLETKKQAPLVDTEIQVIRIGSAAFVMVPAELFVEFGLEIKLRSPLRPTYIVELANGIVGYIPTRTAFANGGYEQQTANSSKLDPCAGEMVVAGALRSLNQVAGVS